MIQLLTLLLVDIKIQNWLIRYLKISKNLRYNCRFPKSQIKKLIELSRKRIPSLSSDKDESEEMMHKINVIKASSKGKSGLQNINHSVIQDDNLLNNIIKSKL